MRGSSKTKWWLLAALAVAAFYSALALRAAFAAPQLVQDDARQHVFWAARFRDPTLFPNDLIADYFQAVAPAGYKAIYWSFAHVGVDPLLLSRILPAIIGLFIGYLAFRLILALTNNGAGACLASILVCQAIWSKDDIVSASPRAFAYPLLLAFLLALVRRRSLLTLLVLALEGLIYPQLAFVCAGTLVLGVVHWQDRRLHFSRTRNDYIVALAAMIVVAATVLPFARAVAPFAPAMTRAEAVRLPEFQQSGRMQTFVDPVDYWLTNAPTGLLPTSLPVHVVLLAVAGLILIVGRRASESIPNERSRSTSDAAAMVARLLVASIGLWLAAHILLFRLHLPARYSQYVLRILIPMLAVVPLQFLFGRISPNNRFRTPVFIVIGLVLVIVPFTAKKFPNAEYIPPRSPGLDAFLQGQPKTVLIATLRPSASTIPVFAHRSVLVSAEHAIAYHAGYYHQIRQRGRDLVAAHLTNRPEDLRAFIDKYHVDLFIVPREPITPAAVAKLRWYREITANAEPGAGPPVLPGFVDTCKVWENNTDIVLDAHRIAQTIAAHEISP